ncbi:MAG: hypothetical protein GC187_05315 [Alphaproteobacteria bacterium]|nr:hypothetical protein [Alphaproteobacteria bacterium]
MAWSEPLRKLFAVLALTGVLTGGLIPSGWMPQASADGLTLVICTGQGPVQIQVDEHGEIIHPGDPAPVTGEAPCSFCSTAGAVLSETAAAPVPVDRSQARVSVLTRSLILDPAATPPGSRGPPACVKHTRPFA